MDATTAPRAGFVQGLLSLASSNQRLRRTPMKTWLTHRMLVCVSARRSENDTGSKLSLQKAIARVLILWVLTAAAASAQTFTTLVDFDGSNGANPDPKALVQGADGNLYGTAQNGGTNNSGLQLNVPARKGGPLALGGQLKTGQLGSLQNRPTVWPRT